MKMRMQWQQLAEREQLVISIGSLSAIALLIYLLLIQPLNNALATLEAKVEAQQNLISWLKPATQQVQQFNAKGYYFPKITAIAPIAKITASLTASHLNNCVVTQEMPVKQQRVSVSCNAVPFDQAIAWLTALWLANGWPIATVTVNALNPPGLVQLRLTLIT